MIRRIAWGLDLGRSAVKGVLLTLNDGGVEILKADIVPLEGNPPDPSEDPTRDGRLWKALHKFHQRNNLRRYPICLAIPAQNIFVRDLTVARVTGRKLEEMVRFEASNEIPFVLDEVIWCYTLFPERPGDKTLRGLLLAVKKNVVQTYLQVFREFQIGPVDYITVAPLALLNYLQLVPKRNTRILALDVGAENTNMLLVDNGWFWMRNMLVGGNRATAILQQDFGLDFATAQKAKENLARAPHAHRLLEALRPAVDDLARDVKTNVGYLESASGRTGFDALHVLGGGARLPGLKDLLGRLLRQEVKEIGPLEGLSIRPGAHASLVQANLDLLPVAIGAAMCPLGKDVAKVSFLPRVQAQAAQLTRARSMFLAVGLAAWAVLLTLYVAARHISSRVRGPLEHYQQFAALYQSRRQELSEAQDTAAIEREMQYLALAAGAHGQPYDLLSEIVAVFRAAAGASAYGFQITTFKCEAAAEPETPQEVQRPGRVTAASAPSPSPADDLRTGWFVGTIEGNVVPAPRSRLDESYSRFGTELLNRLRSCPALAKTAGTAQFAKGSRSVRADGAQWKKVIRPGDMLQVLPQGDFYPIESVLSDDELALTEPYKGEDGIAQYLITRVERTMFDLQTMKFAIRFEVPARAAPSVEELLGSAETQ